MKKLKKSNEKIEIKKLSINSLNDSYYNPRVKLEPGDKEYEAIKRSIEEFGYVEPIIVNYVDGLKYNIISGHQRKNVLIDLGYERVDCIILELSKEKEKVLNIAMNKITGKWDNKLLSDLLNEIKNNSLDDFYLTGFDDLDLEGMMKDFNKMFDSNNSSGSDSDSDDSDSNLSKEEKEELKSYTDAIKAPIYQPTKDKPEINELVNTNRVNELLEKIKKSKLPKDEKEFLRLAAQRFLVFSYDKIAEYYCHSNIEMQEMMETLALVIIDFNKAIENGLTEFVNNIFKHREEDDKFEEI